MVNILVLLSIDNIMLQSIVAIIISIRQSIFTKECVWL